MTHRELDYAGDGFHVLALAEEYTRTNHNTFNPITLQKAFPDRLPHLTDADFVTLFGFLSRSGMIKSIPMYGGSAYELTDEGHNTVWRGKEAGQTRLQFNRTPTAPVIHVAQGATGQIQANVNTGSGTIHATQTNTIGAAEQTEIAALLQQLREVIARLPVNPDQQAAQHHVDTAAAAAGESRWQDVAARMQAFLVTVGLIVSTTADAQPAIETARRVLHVLGVGT